MKTQMSFPRRPANPPLQQLCERLACVGFLPSANRSTQASNGDAWAQSRAANPTRVLSTSPCFLLSLSHLPRKDLPTRRREPELQL